MIIITGTAIARDGALDELRRFCAEHTQRSRLEPGCLSHAFYIDPENANRIFFFETWADRAAVDAHFAVPASGAFIRAAAQLTTEPPAIQIYDAERKT